MTAKKCTQKARCTCKVVAKPIKDDADSNENVKKTICLISKTTTSQVHHAFLYLSFLFLHDYDVKMPNFAFYGGRATTKFYFFLSLDIIWNSASGGFAYIWQSNWVGIIAIKTEGTQIHFLSDVLLAVASLDLKVPIAFLRSQWGFPSMVLTKMNIYEHWTRVTLFLPLMSFWLIGKTTCARASLFLVKFLSCRHRPTTTWKCQDENKFSKVERH